MSNLSVPKSARCCDVWVLFPQVQGPVQLQRFPFPLAYPESEYPVRFGSDWKLGSRICKSDCGGGYLKVSKKSGADESGCSSCLVRVVSMNGVLRGDLVAESRA